jgi:hypothetical protein
MIPGLGHAFMGGASGTQASSFKRPYLVLLAYDSKDLNLMHISEGDYAVLLAAPVEFMSVDNLRTVVRICYVSHRGVIASDGKGRFIFVFPPNGPGTGLLHIPLTYNKAKLRILSTTVAVAYAMRTGGISIADLNSIQLAYLSIANYIMNRKQ